MVRDGRKSEVLIDLGALPTDQNKGFKSLTDHGVETPMLLCSNYLRTSACAYIKSTAIKPEELLRKVKSVS